MGGEEGGAGAMAGGSEVGNAGEGSDGEARGREGDGGGEGGEMPSVSVSLGETLTRPWMEADP